MRCLLAILPLLGMIGASCRSEPVTQIRYVSDLPLRTSINLRNPKLETENLLVAQLWSPLVEWDGANEFLPAIADKWSHDLERRHWVFRIREGLKWADGSDLTASAVVRSFEDLLARTRNRGFRDQVKRVRVSQSNEITLDLKAYSEHFLPTLTWFTGYIADPSNYRDPKAGLIDLKDPRTRFSGPYRIKQWNQNHLELEANPHSPVVDPHLVLPVSYQGGVPPTEMVARVERNEADIARLYSDSVPTAELERLRSLGHQTFGDSARGTVAGFVVGRGGADRISSRDRSYLFRRLVEAFREDVRVGRKDLSLLPVGITPPLAQGSLSEHEWNLLIEGLPAQPSRRFTVQVFVARPLQSGSAYQIARRALISSPVDFHEVVFDPERPESAETRRRESGDFDLLYYAHPVDFRTSGAMWQKFAEIQEYRHPPLTTREVQRVTLARPALQSALFSEFEKKNARDPFFIPLLRVSRLLIVSKRLKLASDAANQYVLRFWKVRNQ